MARSRAAKARTPATPQSSVLVDLGLPSLKIRGGRIEEEWRTRLRGKNKYKVYREMGDADVTAGGFINAVIGFLGKVEINARPKGGSKASAAATAMAERIDGAWRDMEQTPSAMLAEVLLHAVRDGSAPMEVTHKICRGESDDPLFSSDFNDGLLAWKSFGIRPLESVDRWGYDSKTNRITSMVQVTEPDYRTRTIPIEKLLIFKFRGAKGSPEGVSMLSLGERCYYFKKILEELEAVGAKRDLAGLPVVRVPVAITSPNATADQAATFEQMKTLATLVDRDELEGVVFPASKDENGKETGFDFSLMASSGSRQFDLDKVIRRIRGEMSVGFGAGFMYAGHDGVGARSLDESKQDAFKLAAISILRSICETLDTAVVDLMRLNKVPRELWPHFEHGPIDDVSLTEFVNAVNTGFSSGALTHDDEVENEYRKRAQIKPRTTAGAISMLTPTDVDVDEPDAEPATKESFAATDLRAMMTMKEVMQTLRLGKTRVLQLVDDGEIEGHRIRGVWRFDPKTVHDMLSRGSAKKEAEDVS